MFVCLFVVVVFFYFKGAYGLWTDHVLPYWEHRNDPHILFLKYEDLKKVKYYIYFCLEMYFVLCPSNQSSLLVCGLKCERPGTREDQAVWEGGKLPNFSIKIETYYEKSH